MHLLHEIDGIQQISFDRARRRSPNIDAGHGSRFGKDDRAASQPLRSRHLANLDARHIRDAGRWRTCVELTRPSC